MKREWPHDRRILLPASFVRPSVKGQLNLAPDFPAIIERRRRTKKIFVVKQTSRLPSAKSAGRKIQRVLIFDNHPDSLRLVFGGRPYSFVDLSRPQRISLWELLIVSILVIAGLVGIFWPVFKIFAP
jgi:hypothetical protein